MQPLLNLNKLETSGLSALPPLALYIHFPWCIQKCPYCDFNSHQVSDSLNEDRYIDALITDLESSLPDIWGRSITSIFMGGGTPSLFSAASIDRLLNSIRARIKILPDAEITLEANPGTFEIEKFAGFKAAGINRLSIGVQSFNNDFLRVLGRVHDAEQAQMAIKSAVQIFDRVNVDLMYALPEQSLAQALSDVDIALSLGVTHISAYHLTIEPNTLFYVNTPKNLPDDDVSADMQEAIEAKLAAAGFMHYETSAFAKPGQYSRHNVNYWQFGDYLGIGAGAHGKISSAKNIVRQMRYKSPKQYFEGIAKGSAVQINNAIASEDLAFEFLMNALRLTDGFAVNLLYERTGLFVYDVESKFKQASELGLLEISSNTIKPTLKGQRFLNDLLQLFLNDERA